MSPHTIFKSTWFMKTGYCRVSGLPVTHPEAFISQDPDSSYRVATAKLGDRILLVKATGYVRSGDMSEAINFIDAYCRRHFESFKNLVLIEDYTDVEGAEAGARKQYFRYYKDHGLFIAGIIFNLPRLFKISYNLAKRLQFFREPVYAVDNYSQAIDTALQIIRQTDPHEEQHPDINSLSVAIPNRFFLYSGVQDFLGAAASGLRKRFMRYFLSLGSRFNKRFARYTAELLLDYIESIDWQKEGGESSLPVKYGDESINRVFEAISYIKHEIDRLIDEQMAADHELKKSEARYRQLVEHAKAGILWFNRDTGHLESFNDVLFDITGYTRSEITSMSVLDLLNPESQEVYKQRYERLLAGETLSPDVVYQLVTKSGDIRWVLINTSRPFLDGKPDTVHVVLSDITELKRIENQLREYQSKLKSLSIQLSKTQEDERRMLASRLHDGVSQELFAAHLQLNTFEKKLGDATYSLEIRHIRDQIQKVIKETKTLTFDLSPPVLYDFGLQEALESLAATTEEKYGILIRRWYSGDLDKVGDEIKIIIYRIISELLQNTVKHSGARQIRISLNHSEPLMTVDFEDDGIGFDSEGIHADASGYEGFGIFDIREKITHLGGNIVIDSSPERGTAIMMEVPVPMENLDSQQAAGQ